MRAWCRVRPAQIVRGQLGGLGCLREPQIHPGACPGVSVPGASVPGATAPLHPGDVPARTGMLWDAALATSGVCRSRCWEQVLATGDSSSPPMFPLYPRASLPAALLLGPPEPLLSDGVGTGGDRLTAAAACAGRPWGAISGRELSTGSREGSNHIPRPTARQGLLRPHWWTTSDQGDPTCTPVAPYPGIFSAGSKSRARTPAAPNTPMLVPQQQNPQGPLLQ